MGSCVQRCLKVHVFSDAGPFGREPLSYLIVHEFDCQEGLIRSNKPSRVALASPDTMVTKSL